MVLEDLNKIPSKYYEEINELKDIRSNLNILIKTIKLTEKETEKEIAAAKKSEHYISNLSKHKKFNNFLSCIIRDVVANDITLAVAKKFYKKYEVAEANKLLTDNNKHCLDVSSYEFTSIKIAKLMQLALLNQNKIDDSLLKTFTLFIM